MKTILIICLSLLILPVYAEEINEDKTFIYLEGTSLVGKKKTAYLELYGEKIRVNEGDYIKQWQVKQIDKRIIVLVNPTGEDMIVNLRIRTALPEKDLQQSEINDKKISPPLPTDTLNGIKEAQFPIPEAEHNTTNFKEIKTPFGNFLVQQPIVEEQSQQSIEPQTTIKPVTVNEDKTIPDGYIKVNTPFGDFLMREKKEVLIEEQTIPSQHESE